MESVTKTIFDSMTSSKRLMVLRWLNAISMFEFSPAAFASFCAIPPPNDAMENKIKMNAAFKYFIIFQIP